MNANSPLPGWTRCLLIAVFALLSSGCAVDRPWFQMNSNSPMPFFGFDLMPRRSASLDQTEQERSLVNDLETEPPIHLANQSESAKSAEERPKVLRLKTFSELLEGEHDISLIGPQAPFVP